ncbi:thymidylate synthase [Sphingomonas aurantiaca]|uniref:thymidylate synthase n=1 Tax=Sphingomonas aurantiaca TaxID=185949 RepID=UPI0033633B3A
MERHRNVDAATAWNAREILTKGEKIAVRGQMTKELTGVRTRLQRPWERYVFHPHRKADVFAQAAETMWMLAGRDDVSWLERYLPRAPDFSDDGSVWRAAYGPRLRNWNGVDQIEAVSGLLEGDLQSRRAVMSLFDPGRDFVPSKDVPCNNWLGWIVRDGRLDMHAALRSNDLWWGFSGTNAFGWSVLQEMLAHWVGVAIGEADYLAMSLHIYERHWSRAERTASLQSAYTPYDFGVGRAAFATPRSLFDGRLDTWFELEALVSSRPDAPIGSHGQTGDPLMDSALALLHLKWATDIWDDSRLQMELAALPDADWVAAAYERIGRHRPWVLKSVPQPSVASYIEAAHRPASAKADGLIEAMKRLHSVKDRAYGGAWKRRGELVSILPNIARKVDRLEVVVREPAAMDAETLLDTGVDLLVYVCKYCLFIAEALPPGCLLTIDAPTPLTDHERNVEAMLDRVSLLPDGRSIEGGVAAAARSFEKCWRAAEAGAPAAEKLQLGLDLLTDSSEFVALVAMSDGAAVDAMVRETART